MTAQILDGNALGQKLRADFKQRAEELAAQGVRPGLAVILVGEDPASQVYVRNKVNACAQAGFHSEKYAFPADIAPQAVFDKIAALNADPKIHGILVQLPLPRHFDADAVLDAIAPEKDVDGFRAENVGALMQGQPCFIPCTPYGAMKFFEEAGISLKGKEVVVVGRSNIVGKPVAQLLLAENCTVTIAHSRSRELAAITRRADLLIAAVGRPEMIRGDWIKPGATVIDVGINRVPGEGGKHRLVGDVHFASAQQIAGAITPVPGGVGPMTIACLLRNTLTAATARRGLASSF